MAQTNCVMERLKRCHPSFDFEIKTIKTTGDKISDVALSKIGDKGLFTKEIEEALLKQKIDCAVHSMKDLPTQIPHGLMIAAVTERENPCDVLVSGKGFTIEALPRAATIGTSSLRRRAQLLHKRNDLTIVDLRGNLDTRVKKLEKGSYDAIMLAYAGIKRLGLQLKLSMIPIDDILPQAGQGALGIETRQDNGEMNDALRVLDDADCHLSIDAERALLAGLEGGCQVPIGVYAYTENSQVTITAGVFSLDGARAVRDEITGPKKEAASFGSALAERMLKKEITRQILDEVRKGAR